LFRDIDSFTVDYRLQPNRSSQSDGPICCTGPLQDDTFPVHAVVNDNRIAGFDHLAGPRDRLEWAVVGSCVFVGCVDMLSSDMVYGMGSADARTQYEYRCHARKQYHNPLQDPPHVYFLQNCPMRTFPNGITKVAARH